jgi:peptidoglycan/xylan/chitin deacetylase (PgdA/CDA1 family)
MAVQTSTLSRRAFMAAGAAAGGGLLSASSAKAATSTKEDQALIAITLDLEMARNFPEWEDTEWDYIKGNLTKAAKDYSVASAKLVKSFGGRIHFFTVARVFEQADVDWLKGIVEEGHPLGNHTYDHVYVLAKTREDIQYRFKRAPWLIEGKSISEVIRENIAMADRALMARIGIKPAGFRTPGGFATGLHGREDVQNMLLDLGFDWVSCKYPQHPYGETKAPPTKEVLEGIVKAQEEAQPFVYPTGLIDVPMSPISDIGAFRNSRWNLEGFMTAVRLGVEWAIENRATYDFLAHPSVIGVMDPEMRTMEMICKMVADAGDKAAIVDCGTLAKRAKA